MQAALRLLIRPHFLERRFGGRTPVRDADYTLKWIGQFPVGLPETGCLEELATGKLTRNARRFPACGNAAAAALSWRFGDYTSR